MRIPQNPAVLERLSLLQIRPVRSCRRACSIGCARRLVFGTISCSPKTPACNGVRRFVLFHAKRHPQTMGAAEVALMHLAGERHVAPSTQNQVEAALLFLCKEMRSASAAGRACTDCRPRVGAVISLVQGADHAR